MRWELFFPIPNIPLLAFLLGIVYGVLHPGREDRIGMLKKSIGIGVLLGLIFGILIALFLPGILSVFALGITVFAFLVLVLSIAIPFVIGTLIGDIIESLL